MSTLHASCWDLYGSRMDQPMQKDFKVWSEFASRHKLPRIFKAINQLQDINSSLVAHRSTTILFIPHISIITFSLRRFMGSVSLPTLYFYFYIQNMLTGNCYRPKVKSISLPILILTSLLSFFSLPITHTGCVGTKLLALSKLTEFFFKIVSQVCLNSLKDSVQLLHQIIYIQ